MLAQLPQNLELERDLMVPEGNIHRPLLGHHDLGEVLQFVVRCRQQSRFSVHQAHVVKISRTPMSQGIPCEGTEDLAAAGECPMAGRQFHQLLVLQEEDFNQLLIFLLVDQGWWSRRHMYFLLFFSHC